MLSLITAGKAGMAEDKEAGRVCTQVACQRKHQGQGQSIGKGVHGIKQMLGFTGVGMQENKIKKR